MGAVTSHRQRFYPQAVHLSWLENCYIFKGMEQPTSKQNSDCICTLESLKLWMPQGRGSEHVLTCKMQDETQPHTAHSSPHHIECIGNPGKLTSVSYWGEVLTHRVPFDLSSSHCHLGFPPGPECAADNHFHSYLLPQMLEPVTGELMGALVLETKKRGAFLDWQEEYRTNTKVTQCSSLKGELWTTFFIQNVSWNSQRFLILVLYLVLFEVFPSKCFRTLGVRVQGMEVG